MSAGQRNHAESFNLLTILDTIETILGTEIIKRFGNVQETLGQL